jgi:NADH dehydrogenase [ubiquinone] 1 alpha subcomplex assembly factor 1
MTRQLFRFDTAASTGSWQAIDDVVMGGVSASRFAWSAEGWAVFSGVVSLANNGGFASVRAPVAAPAGGGTAFLLTVRSDGQRYKFSVRTDQGFDGVAYQAVFQPPAAEWVTLSLAVADFVPSWRGRIVANAPPLDPARLQQLGLLIADRQEGSFRLEVRAIELAD